MTVLAFFGGVAVGAAFSPFWLAMYNKAKPVVKGWVSKKA